MSIKLQLSRPLASPILNDKGIKRALERGLIKLSTNISDDQLQPGSLDARIGEAYVFDTESREEVTKDLHKMSIRELDDFEFPRSKAKYYPDQNGQPIIIPPGAFAELYIHETILFDPINFKLTYELRSSRGRLALQPISQHPKFDYAHYIEVNNVNNSDIILYGQDKFANLFFNMQRRLKLDHGKVLTDTKKLEKLFPDFAKRNLITPEGYIAFRVGKEAKTFKPGKIIDTKKSIDDSFYNTHDLSNGYLLEKGVPAIVQLTPNVYLPPNIGILLTHRIPFHTNMQQYGAAIADFNQVNAGWVDQGYNGTITAHPVYFMRPRLIKEGDLFAFGIVYLYNSDSDRSYGDKSLKSHYQGSTGATTSKS